MLFLIHAAIEIIEFILRKKWKDFTLIMNGLFLYYLMMMNAYVSYYQWHENTCL